MSVDFTRKRCIFNEKQVLFVEFSPIVLTVRCNNGGYRNETLNIDHNRARHAAVNVRDYGNLRKHIAASELFG